MYKLKAEDFVKHYVRYIPSILCFYDTEEPIVDLIYSKELRAAKFGFDNIWVLALKLSSFEKKLESKAGRFTINHVLLIGDKRIIDSARNDDLTKLKGFFQEIKRKQDEIKAQNQLKEVILSQMESSNKLKSHSTKREIHPKVYTRENKELFLRNREKQLPKTEKSDFFSNIQTFFGFKHIFNDMSSKNPVMRTPPIFQPSPLNSLFRFNDDGVNNLLPLQNNCSKYEKNKKKKLYLPDIKKFFTGKISKCTFRNANLLDDTRSNLLKRKRNSEIYTPIQNPIIKRKFSKIS